MLLTTLLIGVATLLLGFGTMLLWGYVHIYGYYRRATDPKSKHWKPTRVTLDVIIAIMTLIAIGGSVCMVLVLTSVI